MSRATAGALAAALVLFAPALAAAQACGSQLDCRGGRLCKEGRCTAPACLADTDCGPGRYCTAAGACESASPTAAPPAPPARTSPRPPPDDATPARLVARDPAPLAVLEPVESLRPTPGGQLGLFVAASAGVGAGDEAYVHGRGNESIGAFVWQTTGEVGVHVGEGLSTGLAVTFMPMMHGTGGLAPFGSIDAMVHVRPAARLDFEAMAGFTGGGVTLFGGIGPGFGLGVAVPVVKQGRSSFDVGARALVAYLFELHGTGNKSVFIVPTVNVGYTYW